MDRSEKIVFDFLSASGYLDIVYEPAGNVPPDFLVDGRIAVEVRRLNQNFELPNGDFYGLEENFYPTWQRFERFLSTLGPSIEGESWYVGFTISNPPDPWRIIEPLLKTKLTEFMLLKRRQTRIQITEHLR